ncbi:MAG TPA: 16S rRNA (cytosine(967)-C(5))-methyltransferase RsmB [Oscillatoriaceae cyanobacterium]
MANARAVALENLLAVEAGGAFANLTHRRLDALEPADRRLANELIAGVTRRRRTLDWTLDQLLKHPVDTLTPPIRNILRLGAYQLLYLERIPASAAVDEAVKLARRYGHPGVVKLVNGVLRNVIRRRASLEPPRFAVAPLDALRYRYALPDWLAERWHGAFGAEAEALGEWSVSAPHLALRTNTLRTTPEALCEALSSAGVPIAPSAVVPEGLRLQGTLDVRSLLGYNEGWWYVQDEAAMLVSRCLAPKPGETVIDVGAAPGGKTTHLAALMGNQGVVYAVEAHPNRLARLEENCRRLGVTNVQPVVRDARDLSGLPAADRILLDVPCSGLGVLPRKPDARWRQSPEAIAELGALQLQLLDTAADNLKPGGSMVYSTCTISPEENQTIIRRFLAQHPQFRLGDLADCLPERWRGDVEDGGMIQLLPQRHGVDGFFIAKLRKEPTA